MQRKASLRSASRREIEDNRLGLVFTCCHAPLPPEGQVALTLREVCGLTTEKIARAFLVTPAALAQRIVRAKAIIRDKAFAKENKLATLIGTTTAGEVMDGANFDVGDGYRLRIPVTTWQTWNAMQIKNAGVAPDIGVDFRPHPADREQWRQGILRVTSYCTRTSFSCQVSSGLRNLKLYSPLVCSEGRRNGNRSQAILPQWTVQRQERITRLTQDVWADRIWSDSKKVAVTVEPEGDNLVDGMGFE
jgi:hypothetical protein